MYNNYRIDNILNYWAEVARSNPNYQFNNEQSSRSIYGHIIRCDVSKEDRQIDLSSQPSTVNSRLRYNKDAISPYALENSTFNNWIQQFSNKKTEVFISPSWTYFCQFISKDKSAQVAKEHIKIYVPLDSIHIEYGAKMIFDFLENNNISHLSKVGRAIRFDNIVIRLVNPSDAEKLLDFIKNNSYIQSGLIKANPFAFEKDGIAMAVDGSLSYNDTVAKLIDIYIDNRKRNNQLDIVSTSDFYNFIYALYKNQFVEKRDNYLANLMGWEKHQEKNYREVISLIIKAHNPYFTFNDYIEHYKTCANIQTLTPENIAETNRLLLEALQAMTIRFNTNGLGQVRAFFDSGRPELITSQQNLRNRMINSNFRAKLKRILQAKNLDFDTYSLALLNQYGINLDALVQRRTK